MSETIIVSKLNDVYVQLDAEPGLLREIGDHFTFDVPGAKWSPKFKSGFWDGTICLLDRYKNTLYYGLVPQLIDFVRARDYEIVLDSIDEVNDISPETVVKFAASLDIRDSQGEPMAPHPHQLYAVLHAVRHNRALMLSPTSSGKSLIIHILSRWYKQHKKLIIVPTTGLVLQMRDDLISYGEDPENIQIIMGGYEKTNHANIVISTWQSIVEQPKRWFEPFRVVVGDEAHLYKAKSLVKIMTALTNCPYRFGVTGTLDGSLTNELVLQGLFGKTKRIVTTKRLMDEKKISTLNPIVCLNIKYSDQERKAAKKLTYEEELRFLYSHPKRTKFIAKLACGLKGNTLIMFSRIEHGNAIFSAIQDIVEAKHPGRNVLLINGAVPAEERERIRHLVEDTNDTIIVASFGTTSTGANYKKLHNMIFAAPTKSLVRVLQSIGRSLRLAKGKSDATLYDVSDDISSGSWRNHTLGHFYERLNVYDGESFPYKIVSVDLS